MPSAVAGYYTTKHKPRNIAISSDYIKSTRYDKASLVLYVTFYNNQVYKYFGVPEDIYKGMMNSPSHGVYFYANIRQSFTYELVNEYSPVSPSNSPNLNANKKVGNGSSIASKAVPELAKLDILDSQELSLTKELNRGLIDQNQYDNVLNVIKNKREKLIKKLEKDGYFSDCEEVEEDYFTESELQEINQALAEANTLKFWSNVKLGFVVLAIILSIAIIYHIPGFTLFFLMGLFAYYFK